MITAAIVGLGRWGQTLVRSVQGKSERLRFAAAVSRDPARVQDFTTRHGLAVVGSLDAVLADPAIDAVVLASPHTAGVTKEARVNMGRIAAEQILDALDGKRPPRIVNPEVWPAYVKRFERAFGFAPK